MTTEPRFDEDEVREIFERAAASAQGRALATRDGLTVAELQAIGREVGLAPEQIAEAAAAIELRRGAEPRRTVLGAPLAVGRTVPLPRALTDHEWERLVADLRQTFRARGHVRSSGNLREWTNGNLHAFVEPSGDGWRLRLGTTKGDAVTLLVLGAGGTVVGLVMLLFMVLAGEFSGDLMAALTLTLSGGGALGYSALRLPAWADEREHQMAHIAERVRALVEGEAPARPHDRPEPPDPTGPPEP